jgi:hypothetical protein
VQTAQAFSHKMTEQICYKKISEIKFLNTPKIAIFKYCFIINNYMVEVKFRLAKTDFIWIGLLIILVGIGFSYAYGGSGPTIMGHSIGEIEGVCLSNGTGCDVTREYVDSATAAIYNVCTWHTGTECPTINGSQSMMVGFNSNGQVRCCGKSASECTPYGWTTYNTVCSASATCTTNNCGNLFGTWEYSQRRQLDDCAIEYRVISGELCEFNCRCPTGMRCSWGSCEYK